MIFSLTPTGSFAVRFCAVRRASNTEHILLATSVVVDSIYHLRAGDAA